MKQYIDLLRDVQDNGRGKADRTGTGTRAVFGRQIRMNLADGFPLLTTKKMFTRGMLAELLWFLSGDTNEHTLRDQNVNIWREWADPETGDLGRIYGAQWRNWRSYRGTRTSAAGQVTYYDFSEDDQIANLLRDLKTNPTSRRHIVTAWNPGELDQMALPPCHCLFQFYCEELPRNERFGLAMTGDYGATSPRDISEEAWLDALGVPRYSLSCQLYQRSDKSALAA